MLNAAEVNTVFRLTVNGQKVNDWFKEDFYFINGCENITFIRLSLLLSSQCKHKCVLSEINDYKTTLSVVRKVKCWKAEML